MRAKKIQGWYEWRNIVFNPSYDNHIHTTSIVRSTKSLHPAGPHFKRSILAKLRLGMEAT